MVAAEGSTAAVTATGALAPAAVAAVVRQMFRHARMQLRSRPVRQPLFISRLGFSSPAEVAVEVAGVTLMEARVEVRARAELGELGARVRRLRVERRGAVVAVRRSPTGARLGRAPLCATAASRRRAAKLSWVAGVVCLARVVAGVAVAITAVVAVVRVAARAVEVQMPAPEAAGLARAMVRPARSFPKTPPAPRW